MSASLRFWSVKQRRKSVFPFVTCFLAGFLFCPRTKRADASSWKHEAVISIGPQKALRGEEQEFGGISVEQGKSRA